MTKQIEKIFKALSDMSRLRIVNMLNTRSLCVCEMRDILKLSQSTVSGHLRVLKEAGLVEDSKDGLWVEYRLCKTDSFTAGLLNLVGEAFRADETLEKERELALKVDRELICKR